MKRSFMILTACKRIRGNEMRLQWIKLSEYIATHGQAWCAQNETSFQHQQFTHKNARSHNLYAELYENILLQLKT